MTRRAAPAQDAKAERPAEYERGFRRAGLPFFSEDFSADTDVFNRAAPLLALVFISQMFGAIQLDWSWWQNALAVLGGLTVLVVAFGLLNRARDRSFWAVPERLGKTELAGFVLIPALLPLIFGADDEGAIATAGQIRSALGLIASAVPLLAIFALLSFTTEELWRIYSSMTTGIYFTVIGLFVLLGTVFLIARIPREAKRLEDEAGEGSPRSAAASW